MFVSDNVSYVCPEVMRAIDAANIGDAVAYGDDEASNDLDRAFSRIFRNAGHRPSGRLYGGECACARIRAASLCLDLLSPGRTYRNDRVWRLRGVAGRQQARAARRRAVSHRCGHASVGARPGTARPAAIRGARRPQPYAGDRGRNRLFARPAHEHLAGCAQQRFIGAHGWREVFQCAGGIRLHAHRHVMARRH